MAGFEVGEWFALFTAGHVVQQAAAAWVDRSSWGNQCAVEVYHFWKLPEVVKWNVYRQVIWIFFTKSLWNKEIFMINNCTEPGHSTSLLPCRVNLVKLGGPRDTQLVLEVPEPANPVPVMWRDAVHPQMQPAPPWVQPESTLNPDLQIHLRNVTETQRTCCLLLFSTLHTWSYLWVASSENAVMIFKTFDSFQVFSLETQNPAVSVSMMAGVIPLRILRQILSDLIRLIVFDNSYILRSTSKMIRMH